MPERAFGVAPKPLDNARGHSAQLGATPIPPLYHFTCDHHVAGIVAVGAIVPNYHEAMPRLPPMVWLTSDPHPTREDVGLTSMTLNCDRMAHRFMVIEPIGVVPWDRLYKAIRASDIARQLGYHDVAAQLQFGRDAATWWVSTFAIPAVLG